MLERKFGKFLIVKSINFYLIRYFLRKKPPARFPKGTDGIIRIYLIFYDSVGEDNSAVDNGKHTANDKHPFHRVALVE